ncbi:MAG: hypothetical protein QG673_1970 [Pseudomonadota bacterium]|nr:hypothetical protein [Pseudomonadota bacterium]
MKKRVRVLLAASAILAMPLANASLGGNYNKNLVVQTYGSPGNYSGVAYVPSLLPSGFDVTTLGNLGD